MPAVLSPLERASARTKLTALFLLEVMVKLHGESGLDGNAADRRPSRAALAAGRAGPAKITKLAIDMRRPAKGLCRRPAFLIYGIHVEPIAPDR